MIDRMVTLAMAAPAGEGQGSPFGMFVPMILIFGIFYFMLIRPQMKRAKEHKAMVSALAVGDEVVTSGGMLGKVTEAGDQFLTVEVADGVRVKVQRHTVTSVLPKGTYKNA